MNLVVCFKMLPDPERILQQDFQNFQLGSDLAYAGSVPNCFDASALEIALQLKEQAAVQGMEVTCTALTLSDSIPPLFCENLYAVGFDRVLCLAQKSYEFAPRAVAKALSDALKTLSADVVLFGEEAGFAETGTVPYFVAAGLGLPLCAHVESATLGQGTIQALCRTAEGLFRRTCKAPLALVIGNSPAVLRYATLRARMKCRGKAAERLPYKAAVAQDAPELSCPDTRRHCQLLDAKDSGLFETLLTLCQTAEKAKSKEEEHVPFDLSHTLLLDIDGEGMPTAETLGAIPTDRPYFYVFPDSDAGNYAAACFATLTNFPSYRSQKLVQLQGTSMQIQKRAYSSNLLWTQRLLAPAIVLFKEKPSLQSPAVLRLSASAENTAYKDSVCLERAKDLGLSDAKLVVACGVGMGSKAATDKARELAKKLGAGFGLTRPAALNAWGTPEEIIGQSGTVTHADCVLVLGAAGAGAFLFGIENAKKIIAVNTDEHALLFQNADYGVTMDAETVVDKLLEIL